MSDVGEGVKQLLRHVTTVRGLSGMRDAVHRLLAEVRVCGGGGGGGERGRGRRGEGEKEGRREGEKEGRGEGGRRRDWVIRRLVFCCNSLMSVYKIS